MAAKRALSAFISLLLNVSACRLRSRPVISNVPRKGQLTAYPPACHRFLTQNTPLLMAFAVGLWDDGIMKSFMNLKAFSQGSDVPRQGKT